MTTAAATRDFLADLDDPERFVVDLEAVVFDEHEIKDAAGNVTRRVTKADLELYAATNNQRDKEGQPCAMTIGHTVDDVYDKDGKLVRRAPEQEQPPVVGYWRHWKVRYSAKHKRFVAVATPYVMKERHAEAKTYPRASAEVWRTKKVIDPVAILRRTPERPTQWTYAATGEHWKATETTGPRERYAMDDLDTPDPNLAGTGARMANDPAAPPDANAPDAATCDEWMKCCMSCLPNLQAMHDQYDMGAAPGLAMPGAEIPSAPEPEKETFAMTTAAAPSAREKQLETEVKTLRETLATLEKGLREEKRGHDLEQYAAVLEDGERDEILEEKLEKYAAHLNRLKARKAKIADPAAGVTMLDTTGTKSATEFGQAELEKANHFMVANSERLAKMPHEDRWERARKYAMTGKED